MFPAKIKIMKEKTENKQELKTFKESFKYYFLTFKGLKEVLLGLLGLLILLGIIGWVGDWMEQKEIGLIDIFFLLIAIIIWPFEKLWNFLSNLSRIEFAILFILVILFFLSRAVEDVKRRLEELEINSLRHKDQGTQVNPYDFSEDNEE